jgi:hypothetical protein
LKSEGWEFDPPGGLRYFFAAFGTCSNSQVHTTMSPLLVPSLPMIPPMGEVLETLMTQTTAPRRNLRKPVRSEKLANELIVQKKIRRPGMETS